MFDFDLENVPRDWRVAHIPKPNKPGEFRKITIPNDQLMSIQKGILNDSLYKVDALKPTHFAYGFVPFRNTLDAVSAHDRKADFFCMDIKDFFDTFPVQVVREQLIKGGLEPDYADKVLAACSYKGTIPQGSPASPCLTNIGMKEVDLMLSAFAKSLGLTYTRYADDIVMSVNWEAAGLPRKNIAVHVFKGTDKLLRETLGIKLKPSKSHVIPYRGRSKRQILGITIRMDGMGYNAPRKLRRTTRARCCNLYHKLKAQHGRPGPEDWSEYAQIKGTIQYMDYVRSGSDEQVATADPIIQEKFWNYLEKVFSKNGTGNK